MPVQRLRHRLTIWSTIFALVFAPGCSRKFWREQAEKDTYNAVAEKLDDERWAVPRTNITPDPRSRFYDPYDADTPPLPPGDPAARKFMHCANGIKGYKSWHKFGDSISVENPQWLEPFGVTLNSNGDIDPVSAHSSVELKEITLEEALELSYIHSRDYQTNIENLYLDALALTFQRFQFGVRYLGVNRGEPGQTLNFNSPEGSETWRLNQGFGISQALPAGGQWAIEIANNTLWLFGDGGRAATSGNSLAFSLTQPLLFNAGRKVVMEGLTQAERDVLYSARDLARFRKTFFVDTTASYLRILQQKQGIINAKNNIKQLEEQITQARFRTAVRMPITVSAPLAALPDGFAVPEAIGTKLSFNEIGFLEWRGLTMSDEEAAAVVAVSEDAAYQRAAEELISVRRGDNETTPINVLQLLTQLSGNLNDLRGQERGLQDQLDNFKTQLGLPPDIVLDLDESLLKPFELISSDLTSVELEIKDTLATVQRERGAAADFGLVYKFLNQLVEGADKLRDSGFGQVNNEFTPVEALLESSDAGTGRIFGGDEERGRVTADLRRDKRLFRTAQTNFRRAEAGLARVKRLLDSESQDEAFKKLDVDRDGQVSLDDLDKSGFRGIFGPAEKLDRDEDGVLTSEQLLAQVERACYEIREEMLAAAQTLQVIQAGLRAEQIAVNKFTLPGDDDPSIEEVVRIGLENRVDLMNERATVTDLRRQLEVQANALESTLNLEVSGSAGDRNDSRPEVNVGVSLTTPLDRVQQRNAYATALVNYQRAKRNYMAFEDQVKTQIRNSWRQLQVADQRLEIDRQQIRQAALQYDTAALETSNPNLRDDQAERGALNILQALNGLLGAQNRLIGDWINYETNRLNIYRDMGIMEVNPRGIWTDEFYLQSQNPPANAGLNGSGGSSESVDAPSNPPEAPPTPNEDASDEEPNEAPELFPIPAPPKAAARRVDRVDVARAGHYRGRRRSGGAILEN